jgi:hypothetical protein
LSVTITKTRKKVKEFVKPPSSEDEDDASQSSTGSREALQTMRTTEGDGMAEEDPFEDPSRREDPRHVDNIDPRRITRPKEDGIKLAQFEPKRLKTKEPSIKEKGNNGESSKEKNK